MYQLWELWKLTFYLAIAKIVKDDLPTKCENCESSPSIFPAIISPMAAPPSSVSSEDDWDYLHDNCDVDDDNQNDDNYDNDDNFNNCDNGENSNNDDNNNDDTDN